MLYFNTNLGATPIRPTETPENRCFGGTHITCDSLTCSKFRFVSSPLVERAVHHGVEVALDELFRKGDLIYDPDRDINVEAWKGSGGARITFHKATDHSHDNAVLLGSLRPDGSQCKMQVVTDLSVPGITVRSCATHPELEVYVITYPEEFPPAIDG